MSYIFSVTSLPARDEVTLSLVRFFDDDEVVDFFSIFLNSRSNSSINSGQSQFCSGSHLKNHGDGLASAL